MPAVIEKAARGQRIEQYAPEHNVSKAAAAGYLILGNAVMSKSQRRERKLMKS